MFVRIMGTATWTEKGIKTQGDVSLPGQINKLPSFRGYKMRIFLFGKLNITYSMFFVAITHFYQRDLASASDSR